MRPTVLLAVLLVLLGGIGAMIRFGREGVPPATPHAGQPPAPPPPAPEPPPPPPVGEWAGSDACAECHPDIRASWGATAHALTIRPWAPDVVAKPFDGDLFVARGLHHRMGPGGQVTCEGPGGEHATFKVDFVIGVRRVQMFTTKMDGGRWQVLPVFLEVPKKKWFDYTDFIFGKPPDFEVPPDSTFSWYGPHRNYNSRCGFCHATNYRVGYDPESDTYDTTWSEHAVSCESCHGPAGAHVRHWRTLATGNDPIVNPAKLEVDRANQVCAQCHAESTRVREGFLPGDDLFSFFDLAGLEDTTHLHPDGRAQELIHNYVPNLLNRCGPIRCTQCHDPHGRGIPGGLIWPLEDDRTCTQCHADFADRLQEHTHHAPESAGSRCVNCHMPRMVIEGGHGRVFDHTISIPAMANTRKFGLPNACRSCHVLEYPGWEYEHFDAWYPGADGRNHRVALAAAIEGGRRGDQTARPALEALLADPNPVYRAGAASWLGALGGDVRSALSDPHPMVRRAAIEVEAARHPEAVAPFLDDANPVLRRAAALALAIGDRSNPWALVARDAALRERCVAALESALLDRPDDTTARAALTRTTYPNR